MAVLLASTSSILWGLADFLGGLLTRRHPALLVVVASQLVGLLAVSAATIPADPGAVGPVLVPAALAGLAGSGGLVAFYEALATGRMGVVAPVAALGVLVPVAVGLARGERLSAAVLLGMALAVAGIVAACGPELRGQAGRRPVLLAVGAAAGFGGALVLIADGSRHSPLWTMVCMRAVSVTVLAGIALLVRRAGRGGVSGGPRLSLAGWTGRTVALVVLTGVADVAANLALGVAARSAYVSVVGVLGSLYPVVTVLLAVLVLRERLRGVQAAGVLVALTGVVLVAAG